MKDYESGNISQKSVAEKIGNFARKEFMDDFRHGEGYIESPDLVKNFVGLQESLTPRNI